MKSLAYSTFVHPGSAPHDEKQKLTTPTPAHVFLRPIPPSGPLYRVSAHKSRDGLIQIDDLLKETTISVHGLGLEIRARPTVPPWWLAF